MDRPEVDDPAPATGVHVGKDGPRQHERRNEHHLDQVAPAVDREALDRRDVL